MNDLVQKALDYHQFPTPGKLDVQSSKPMDTQGDLSLAYSPGVAYPCLEIQKDFNKIYDYTSKGNTVAVISDGTAVLGLGNIGAGAGLPVMEGKAVLMKKFAGLNGIPIVIKNHKDIDDFVHIVASLEDSFGAINLEDIKGPECFEIEEKLDKITSIPIFHDDQHGTAIISLAGIITSCELTGRKLSDVKIVINGAGAAAIASAHHYVAGGIKQENITLVDSKGVIFKGREDGMNKYKEELAVETSARTLSDALVGADIFVGMSVADILTQEMIKSMAKDPIIFALANPNPEIKPDLAKEAGARIIATGRSDYPNQVNNVLGFPGIFRGALDARAKYITREMKLAATYALVELAKSEIPAEIKLELSRIYPKDAERGVFDRGLSEDLIIPKPFDPRVVPTVAEAVKSKAKQK